ncbi:EAL domain-containing protein (putative c-di-GMP-specific phosphodiesterase class I) [Biostraticola tofi]|uniref:EAL domain-containing protein (Putative c-di-GMP-specific phosphodiesterase class I) n=2 Tax=Biostraticola tofi TaxID=466109 RepID=A0A4R3YLF7_9GAMM|nr:EAL domain-containing protein (putative c-di-GMP-specific phosphodiesterase class I) [Biostraticola tofi]
MNSTSPERCTCEQTHVPGLAITMAFQPVYDLLSGEIYAQEALVRGADGSSAQSVLDQVNAEHYPAFDQQCRTQAIQDAARLQLKERLHINFMPGASYHPEHGLRSTLAAALACQFPPEQLTFEITGTEKVDTRHLSGIVSSYRDFGFQVALDDFGAGYAGLNLLAQMQPDIVKLDIGLIADIPFSRPRQRIIRAMLKLAEEMKIAVIAEGVETRDEAQWLLDAGINLHQGCYYAPPGFQMLPGIQVEDRVVSPRH